MKRVTGIIGLCVVSCLAYAALPLSDGWSQEAPRDEVRPAFAFDPKGGADGGGALVVTADQRAGLDGRWVKTVPVTGGTYYKFVALYRAYNIDVPRRSVVARLIWKDSAGNHALRNAPGAATYAPGKPPV